MAKRGTPLMKVALRSLRKLLAQATLFVRAVCEWCFISSKTRRRLEAIGVATLKDFVDLRVGRPQPEGAGFFDWIDNFGFGLVKEPTDVYGFMAARLDDQPEYAFSASPVQPDGPTRTGLGFITHNLPSGARFYTCPYGKETPQATTWLYQTSGHMGFVPPWLQTF